MWYPSPFSAIAGVSLRVSRMGPVRLTCTFSSHSSGSPDNNTDNCVCNHDDDVRSSTNSGSVCGGVGDWGGGRGMGRGR